MKNTSLSPQELEESKVNVLKTAIQQGLNSPKVEDFDFDTHLARLKNKQVSSKSPK